MVIAQSIWKQLLGTILANSPTWYDGDECPDEDTVFPKILVVRKATEDEKCALDNDVVGDFIQLDGIFSQSEWFQEAVQDAIGDSIQNFFYNDEENKREITLAATFAEGDNVVTVSWSGTEDDPFIINAGPALCTKVIECVEAATNLTLQDVTVKNLQVNENVTVDQDVTIYGDLTVDGSTTINNLADNIDLFTLNGSGVSTGDDVTNTINEMIDNKSSTITNTVDGHTIATHTGANGTATDIKETVTGLGTAVLTGNVISIPYTNEEGVTESTTVDITSALETAAANISDDQVLSAGANSDLGLTLTPETVTDTDGSSQTNWVIEGTIKPTKIASGNPISDTNKVVTEDTLNTALDNATHWFMGDELGSVEAVDNQILTVAVNTDISQRWVETTADSILIPKQLAQPAWQTIDVSAHDGTWKSWVTTPDTTNSWGYDYWIKDTEVTIPAAPYTAPAGYKRQIEVSVQFITTYVNTINNINITNSIENNTLTKLLWGEQRHFAGIDDWIVSSHIHTVITNDSGVSGTVTIRTVIGTRTWLTPMIDNGNVTNSDTTMAYKYVLVQG